MLKHSLYIIYYIYYIYYYIIYIIIYYHQARYVYVGPSGVPGAGEGLLARRDIKQGQVNIKFVENISSKS